MNKNRKKSGKKTSQQEPPSGKKPAEKQNIIAENAEKNLNTEKQNEQTTRELGTQNDIDKKKELSKPKRTVKPKKGFFSNFFSVRRLFLLYVLAVFFWCNGKTQKQCNSYEEALCFNGISQYILNHDFFHKYIEPTIIAAKRNVDDYGKQALDKASVHYEIRAKPYVDPFLKSAQQNAVEYIYTPIVKGLTKAQEHYNDNAKKHVDNYYDQVVTFSAPYISQAQGHVSYTYEQALEYNKNTFQPWYHKKIVPFVVRIKDKVIFYYDTKIVPFADHKLKVIKEAYHEKIVPAYHKKIVPVYHKVLALFQKSKTETEKKSKAEAEKKTKEEAVKKAKAEKKAKEEADKKARAERKAKEEADKKARAERKAKEEADKKAKAERKAKEEADKKARAERKAKEEADKKAEAERKAKEEADKKAEAERKAKEEADKKAEAERKAKEEADKKAEADRKAKEEADKKAEAEKKAKEEADKKITNEAVRNALLKEFPLARENLTLALDNYERKATSVAQKTLYEVEARITNLKNSGSEYLAKLQKFVEQIKKDSSKDRKTKFNEITDSAKKFIDNIKENSQKFIEISKKSFNNLEEVKFDELKKEFDVNLVSRVYEARENIFNLAQNRKHVDDELKTKIDTTAKNILQEFNENKNSASLRVREIFAIINNKINLLTSTKEAVIKDIHSYIKTEKDNLKSEASEKTAKKNKKDDKNSDAPNVESQDAHKDDNQILEQQKPSAVKASSSDLVLEKLKARQDPILNKLKKRYEIFKAEKGNEPAVQVQPVDDEEYYEDDDDDECSSED